MKTTPIHTKRTGFNLNDFLNSVDSRVNIEARKSRLAETEVHANKFAKERATKKKIINLAFSKTVLGGIKDEIIEGVVNSSVAGLVETYLDINAQYDVMEEHFPFSLATGDEAIIEDETTDYAIYINLEVNPIIKSLLSESIKNEDGLLFEIFKASKEEQLQYAGDDTANAINQLGEGDDIADELEGQLGGSSSDALMETAVSNVSLSVVLEALNMQIKEGSSQRLFSEDIIEPLLSVNLVNVNKEA